jgi:hypothetical protein
MKDLFRKKFRAERSIASLLSEMIGLMISGDKISLVITSKMALDTHELDLTQWEHVFDELDGGEAHIVEQTSKKRRLEDVNDQHLVFSPLQPSVWPALESTNCTDLDM